MYSKQSAAMVRAGELRGQGYDASQALRLAWGDILGEDYEEDEEEDDSFEVLPQSRRRASNPDGASGMGTVLILSGLAYVVWCAYRYSKTKIWSWTPWKTQPVARRLIRPVQTGAVGSIVPVYPARNPQEESIQLIIP